MPAAQSYREAARLCDELHDIHGQTAAVFNLGCVLAETGQFGEALDAFRRALRDLGRLGIVTDLALALYNTGLLFLQLGDLEAASRTARRLRDEANATKAEAFLAFASSLDADIARRQGAPRIALPLYLAAEEAFAHAGNQPMAYASGLARAEALAEAGQAAEALGGVGPDSRDHGKPECLVRRRVRERRDACPGTGAHRLGHASGNARKAMGNLAAVCRLWSTRPWRKGAGPPPGKRRS